MYNTSANTGVLQKLFGSLGRREPLDRGVIPAVTARVIFSSGGSPPIQVQTHDSATGG